MNRVCVCIVVGSALAVPALGQFTGVADGRVMSAGTSNSAYLTKHPPTPFAEWEDEVSSFGGGCAAQATQHSVLTPGAIQAMGEIFLQASRGGANAESRFDMTFHVPFATRYHFFGTNNGGPQDVIVLTRVSDGAIVHLEATGTSYDEFGMLTPGDYRLLASCYFDLAVPFGSFSMGLSWEAYLFGTPCPADFNADGFVDFFDIDAFTACFEGLACPPGQTADFNQDGFVDFFDIDGFVAAFEAGCDG